MSLSKLDASQVLRSVHDDATGTLKTKIESTDISIELDHADGDSVTSHPTKLTASALGVASPADDGAEIIPPLDASSLRSVRVDIDGTGAIDVQASPNDAGNFWYSLGGAATVHNICARRIRVISTNAAGDVHLVGRS